MSYYHAWKMPEKNTLSCPGKIRSLSQVEAYMALHIFSAATSDEGGDWRARLPAAAGTSVHQYVWDVWGFRKPRLQAAQVVFIVVTNLTARLL